MVPTTAWLAAMGCGIFGKPAPLKPSTPALLAGSYLSVMNSSGTSMQNPLVLAQKEHRGEVGDPRKTGISSRVGVGGIIIQQNC